MWSGAHLLQQVLSQTPRLQLWIDFATAVVLQQEKIEPWYFEDMEIGSK